MTKHKREAVTVTFHYLTKVNEEDQGATEPFTQADFATLLQVLESKPKINLKDEKAADRLRYKVEVPIDSVERINGRTIFGVFKASYWGHAYENTARGQIPADSISLRPFHFLLYLSRSGKVYIGCQYLGQFGGYIGLKSTICDALKGGDNIRAHSFRSDGLAMKGVEAKEVRISFSSRAQSIARSNIFTRSGMIAFKKRGRDDGFEDQVSKRLFSVLGQSRQDIKKAIALLLKEGELIDVTDEDIEDCTIVASLNGSKKTIYMLEDGTFASKFPINVPLTLNGHPEYERTKAAMIETLRDQIIARSENV